MLIGSGDCIKFVRMLAIFSTVRNVTYRNGAAFNAINIRPLADLMKDKRVIFLTESFKASKLLSRQVHTEKVSISIETYPKSISTIIELQLALAFLQFSDRNCAFFHVPHQFRLGNLGRNIPRQVRRRKRAEIAHFKESYIVCSREREHTESILLLK